jgi:formylglycine-generating enzyme required for sulfatase activity
MNTPSALQEFSFETLTLNLRGTVVTRERCAAQQIHVALGGGVRLEMVAVPPGAFLMGSAAGHGYDDERPQHRVTVSPFLMSKHLITQEQWAAVIGAAPRCRFQGPTRPVENVSWNAAQEFCQRLSRKTGHTYRLPSEAEWEYACRAGTPTPFSCGYTLTIDLANYNGQFTFAEEPQGIYRHVTTEAGFFPPNAYGLHDMHGNLWEWCADPWHDDYRGAPADARIWDAGGDLTHRVLRGGSWHDTPDVCRSAVRLKQDRVAGDDILGFRVAAKV